MFFEKIKVRWSDIDANKHLANSAYMNFCSQTRMSFLHKNNIGLHNFERWKIGPIILKEVFHFYKEIFADQTIFISLELKGKSAEGTIFNIEHKLYNEKGEHCATSEIIGVWMDMIERKKIIPPQELIHVFDTENLKNSTLITMDDIKNMTKKPKNIDPLHLKFQ